MHVIVCGAGVIGCATAFELSRRGVDVTVVERWRVAGSASGKSGGFLARDWCNGTPVQSLAQHSFDLHEAWADDIGICYGYRKVDTYSGALSARRKLNRFGDETLVPWLADDVVNRQQLGTRATTAQLDPALFTQALMEAAASNGASLQTATVSGVTTTGDDSRVTGVMLPDGGELRADAVVIAMGPWSVLAAQWLALPPVYGLKGHSVIFKPTSELPPEAIFAEFETAEGDVLGPEIVPRADGTLYVCGSPGDDALPVDPAQVMPESGGCEQLADITRRLVPSLADAEIIAEQACFRPITADGIPLIGAVAGPEGGFVASGHSVWGMLNAPGTGEAMADLVTACRAEHIDLAAFDPARLAPLDPRDLQMHAR